MNEFQVPSRVFFFHIPKTGGSSLRAMLQRGTRGNAIEADFVSARSVLNRHTASCSFSGHMHLFPGDWEVIRQHFLTITLLRNPAQRLISSYFQFRRSLPHEANLYSEAATRMELPAYLRWLNDQSDNEASNVYAYWLASLAWDGKTPNNAKVALPLAKSALEQFDIIGFTHNLDAVGQALRHILPEMPDQALRYNTSSNEELSEITKEALSLAEEISGLDGKCYQHALSLLKEGQNIVFGARDTPPDFQSFPIRIPPLNFGDHKVIIANAILSVDGAIHLTDSIPHGAQVSLRIDLVAKQALGDVTVGLSIRSTSGETIFGTNTSLLGMALPEDQSQATITFTFECLLRPGQYLIDVAAHQSLSHLAGCHDWREALLAFNVVTDLTKPYFDGPTAIPISVAA